MWMSPLIVRLNVGAPCASARHYGADADPDWEEKMRPRGVTRASVGDAGRVGRGARRPSWRAVVAVAAPGSASEPPTTRRAHARAPRGDGGPGEPSPERLTATGEPCW